MYILDLSFGTVAVRGFFLLAFSSSSLLLSSSSVIGFGRLDNIFIWKLFIIKFFYFIPCCLFGFIFFVIFFNLFISKFEQIGS